MAVYGNNLPALTNHMKMHPKKVIHISPNIVHERPRKVHGGQWDLKSSLK